MPIYLNRGHGICDIVEHQPTRGDYGDYLREAFQKAIEDFHKNNGRLPELEDINFRGGMTSLNIVIEIEEVV